MSVMSGLVYWSVSDQNWRTLVEAAYALEDNVRTSKRPDFSSEEILSGQTLFFTQDDTRSTGFNIYTITARVTEPDRLVVVIRNESPIKLSFVTLFEPGALVSVHHVERGDGGDWHYQGVSVVRDDMTWATNEKSLVNRAVAYFRFLAGRPGDDGPPLAR